MTETFALRDCYYALEEDEWRKSNRFSDDLTLAHEVLFHPRATSLACAKALSLWLNKHPNQPCLFGRIAASRMMMHYCFLSDRDLTNSDQHVAAKIRAALAAWKRRSFRPIKGFLQPAHGFMLVAASPWVATARPDDRLRAFSAKLRELWGCPNEPTEHGTVHLETLFLENPNDRSVTRFTFSVDFFASQGDGRWWHDHRVPGGVAFTANSVGHMRRYREWYEEEGDQLAWLLRTAMKTIDGAANTEHGRATWLLPVAGNRAFDDSLPFPFSDEERAKLGTIRDMDWTRYGGHLHTDHSIRSEFLNPAPGKSADVQEQHWLEDFAYLYDPRNRDHLRFVNGETVPYDEVIAELGDPRSWTSIAAAEPRRGGDVAAQLPMATEEDEGIHPEVADILERCRQAWEVTAQEVGLLME